MGQTHFDDIFFKNFDVSGVALQFYIKIFNLLDNDNPNGIFSDTGLPDFSLQELIITDAAPTWFIHPEYYSPPRKIIVGTKISL